MTTRKRRLIILATMLVSGVASAAAVVAFDTNPDPVIVDCGGGSDGSAPFWLINNTGGCTGSGANVTGFAPGIGCQGYSIFGSGFVPCGGSAQFTAHASSSVTSPSCTFTVYVNGQPTTETVTVQAINCGTSAPGTLEVTPSPLDIGMIPAGQSNSASFTSLLNNTGQFVNRLDLQLSNPLFTWGWPCPTAGQQSCTLFAGTGGFGGMGYGQTLQPPPEVWCHPMTMGIFSGSATFTANSDPQTAATAIVTCTGTAPTTGPAIVVSPSQITRSAPVGGMDTGLTQPLEITNSGDAVLSVTSVTVTGTNAARWTLSPPAPGPFLVNPGATTTINVTFRPTDIGAQDATIVVQSTDPDPIDQNISVSALGTGLGGRLVIVDPTAPQIDFNMVPVGFISAVRNITVRNDGNIPITVTGGTTSGGAVYDILPASLTLDPGAGSTQSFGVTCLPLAPQAYPGGVRIATTDAIPSMFNISLTCEGVSSQVDIQPAAIDFGAVRIGAPAETRDITITNHGPAVTLADAMLEIGAPGFSIIAEPNPDIMLDTDQTATITVAFAPESTALVDDAVVNMLQTEPGRTVTLSGFGATATAAISGSLDLGSVCTNDLAMTTATVTSTGDAPIIVDTPMILDDPGMVFAYMPATGTTFPVTLTEGANASVDIYATAPDGTVTARLRWPTNLPTALPDETLTLTGVSEGLAATPGSLDFGRIDVGLSSNPLGVSLRACGAVASVNVTPSLVGRDAQVFALTSTAPAAIGRDATRPWEVRFTPPRDGIFTATLRLTPDVGSPIDIELTGVGGDGLFDDHTNYYACGCRAPVDTGGVLLVVLVVAGLVLRRRRRTSGPISR